VSLGDTFLTIVVIGVMVVAAALFLTGLALVFVLWLIDTVMRLRAEYLEHKE
jgi:hypothetical protein